MKMNRREFLAAAIAAGGVITASGLWMPGEKLISIPKQTIVPEGLVRIILEGTAGPSKLDPLNQRNYLPVGVNGEILMVPFGEPVNVPVGVVEVLDNTTEFKFNEHGGRPHIVYPYRRLA